MSETTGHKLETRVWYALLWHPVSWTPFWPGGKESACQCRRHRRLAFNPWVRKIPWRSTWRCTPEFLSGQRNLGGYDPWGPKKLDTTEAAYYVVHTHAFLSLKYLLHRIIERKKINNRGKSQQIYSKCFLLLISFLALDKWLKIFVSSSSFLKWDNGIMMLFPRDCYEKYFYLYNFIHICISLV